MRLGKFIFIILLSIIIIYFFVNYFIQQFYILPINSQLEKVVAIKDINKCIGTIYSELKHLAILNHDWAAWDNTHSFIQNKNKNYINSNLKINSLLDNKLNFIFFYNEKQNMIWGKYVFNDKFSPEKTQFFEKYLTENAAEKIIFNNKSTKEDGIAGIIVCKYGIFLISSEPILTSTNDGPCKGTLIMGKELSRNYIKHISSRVQVQFDITPLKAIKNPELIKFINEKIFKKPNHELYYIDTSNKDSLKIYTFLDNINGKPSLIVKTQIPRAIYQQGTKILTYSLYAILIISIILLIVMILIIQIIIIRPISKLTKHAIQVRSSHKLQCSKYTKRKDEIGILSREFNDMILEIKNINDNLEERIIQRTNEIMNTRKNSVFRLAKAAENRDSDTGLHLKRIQGITTLLAQKLGIEKNKSEMIGLASTLHDIGKIGIQDDILFKKGSFSEFELEIMKKHTEIGAKILGDSDSELIETASKIALYHHERWDGKGYPKGLSGNEIPISAQITSIADVFDALASKRIYKDAWTYERIKDYFIKNKDTQFNPKLVEIFVKYYNDFIRIREENNT